MKTLGLGDLSSAVLLQMPSIDEIYISLNIGKRHTYYFIIKLPLLQKYDPNISLAFSTPWSSC